MKRFPALQLICLFFFFLFFLPQKAQAIVKFNTEFQNYYRIEPNGNTHVTFVISQKNNLSVVYATDFGLNINETKISNVKVHDEGTIVIPDVLKTLNQTTISFSFANKVVGRDKIHRFTIEYDTTDIATKFGNTWQINIPRLESDENVSNQTVIMTVPLDFPVPAFIDPKPDTINKNTYYFKSDNLGNKPISAVFGQTQFYKGTLAYHLSNDSRNAIETEIALPPDTSYQTVFYQKLEPQPQKIYVDADGNYLAKYQLKPYENLDINLSLNIKLNFQPKPTLIPPLADYLKSNSIWNYDNAVFNSPETKNLVTAKSIYDFVVDKMSYDFEKVNRQKSLRTPAAESLINHQSAICTDFTNVFVSLARKAGIYARELEGFAISENPDLKPTSLTQDILHAWPEYFNQANNTWTQIDPTWANTTRGIDYLNKLDFNHLVFVIHGQNPEYPIPAGGYKNSKQNTKDIVIEPTDPIIFPNPEFSLSAGKQENQLQTINILNTQGVSFTGNTILGQNEFFQESEQVISIPPFGESELKIKLIKQPILGSLTTKVIIYINGAPYEQTITIQPRIPQAFFFAAVGLVLAVLAFTARHLYLRRQKQKTSLYR